MPDARSIPRDSALDATIGLAREPYTYISRRCRRRRVDVLRSRLLLRPVVMLTGPDAARLFYDQGRFERAGAMPGRLRIPLVGRGGVQGLDGDRHRHRKAAFIGVVAPTRVEMLAERFEREWGHAASAWATMDRVDLYTQSQRMLTRAVCDWAGVPLEAADVPRRARTLSAMYDGAGALGQRYWRARGARRRGRAWIEGLVTSVRRGELDASPGSAMHVFATFREDDAPLSTRDAATEVINVLRPTVAVSVYIVLIAHALHEHPQWRERLREASDADRDELLRRFVQEVRRFYPFFPMVAARVRQDFEWRGLRFARGTRTVLDLYGTNHDPRAWDRPDTFGPDRFADGCGVGGGATLEAAACPRGHGRDRFEFIPQGGADAPTHHRCPGESIAVELMKVSADWLARRLDYQMPAGDLSIDSSRLPALPRTPMTLARVQSR